MRFKRYIKILQIKVLYFVLNFFKEKPTQNILESFYTKYPDSKYPVWQRIPEGSWQVSFNEDFHQATAVFNDDGSWIGSRCFTQFLLLPQNIREAFESQFKKELIMGVYALKFRKTNIYEFLVSENNKTKSLVFNTSGMLLKTSYLQSFEF